MRSLETSLYTFRSGQTSKFPDANAFQIRPSGKLDKFLEHQFFEPCHSPYSSPAMLVPKNNSQLRLVIDWRQLKKQTIKSCWPMPSIEEIFWKVVVTSLTLTCLGDFINSPWKRQVRTIQRSVHQSDHLNGCECQRASLAVPTLFRVSWKRYS